MIAHFEVEAQSYVQAFGSFLSIALVQPHAFNPPQGLGFERESKEHVLICSSA